MNNEFKRINLEEKIYHRRKQSKRLKWGKVFGAALVVLVLLAIWSAVSSSTSIFRYIIPGVAGSSIKQSDSRVNILLLGIGGGTHDGPDLTDSIIVASYNLKDNNVSMFSIPRDLWLPSIKEKINTAYTIGLSKNGDGLSYTENAISDVVGMPIQYAVVLDFSGFSKAIDLVGGVDVNVPNTFDDYEYPITGKENDLCGWKQEQITVSDDQSKQLNVPVGPRQIFVDSGGKIATDSAVLDFGCRYEHIHFDKGMTHMDGTVALKFVRSRHALGVEGSDFARSKRQQLVIAAFKDKAFSVKTLANPSTVLGLVGTFGDSLKTDIPKSQFLDFYSLAKKAKETNSVVLGDLGSGKSLFINPPLDKYGGAWVLIPPNEDFTQVHKFVQDTLNPPPSPSPSVSPSPSGK